ncbi:uncharacterized protein EAF02_008762 [Botrytis sinoallii]|uniref:uncharacterized protein n=1 Tax=Botrytis sinoallii TaxID=1463999 RepID=UPI001902B2A9|nr:uncharacterized protein EAF02_008762 [Botrytis sinoallii]KAF7872691.1 hypothetical protein EAF02_008762 [Botrytis sinoallii]
MWTVDIKLTYLVDRLLLVSTSSIETPRKASHLLMPHLYLKEEIESANFEEMFKSLNSTHGSSEFRTKFPDYIYMD